MIMNFVQYYTQPSQGNIFSMIFPPKAEFFVIKVIEPYLYEARATVGRVAIHLFAFAGWSQAHSLPKDP